MSNGGSRFIADSAGTYANPVAMPTGTPAFGYTVSGTGVGLASSTFARIPTASGNDTLISTPAAAAARLVLPTALP